METKHTPGPWRLDRSENDATSKHLAELYGLPQSTGLAIVGNVREQAAGVRSYTTVAVVNTDAWEAEANARLIAAAPEMYALLDDALRVVVDATPDGPLGQAYRDLTVRIGAVLAKAVPR